MEGAEGNVCGEEEGRCGAGGEDGGPEVFEKGCHGGRVERRGREGCVWFRLGCLERLEQMSAVDLEGCAKRFPRGEGK